MAKVKTTKASYIFSYILIILLLVAIAGIIAYFTNGFTSDFKTLVVEYDGKNILSSKNDIVILPDKSLTARAFFPFDTKGNMDYSIKIVPNKIVANDFEIGTGENSTTFQSVDEYTKGFVIDKKEDGTFTITPVGRINDVIQAAIPDFTIGDYRENVYDNMFSAVITSSDNKESIILNFSLEKEILVESVSFNEEVIIV